MATEAGPVPSVRGKLRALTGGLGDVTLRTEDRIFAVSGMRELRPEVDALAGRRISRQTILRGRHGQIFMADTAEFSSRPDRFFSEIMASQTGAMRGKLHLYHLRRRDVVTHPA